MVDQVFRQSIGERKEKIGLVGFSRTDGVDRLQIVSWADGETNVAEFKLDDVERLVELIQHAMQTKSRPSESDTLAFGKHCV